jgi:hypothetical protein
METVEVEYRLVSWGEIYPPFMGNREHSIHAQFILQDFPFKLFSVSIPYSELPQKLCLTFRDPVLKRGTEQATTVGPDSDEAATEFAAFLSIYTRRRVFPVGQTRVDGFPAEQPVGAYLRPHSQEPQQIKELNPSEVYQLLRNLQSMDRQTARRCVLSMRLYHSAIEMMYSQPEFAYVFLVMSLEAIASAVYPDLKPGDKTKDDSELDQYLDSTYPGWRHHCDVSTPEKRDEVCKMLLTPAYFVRRKFRKFVCENLPETFWSDTEDDAKPHYHSHVVYPGPDGRAEERIRYSDKSIQAWERIEKSALKQVLDEIYSARSKFVHEGARFPSSIIVGHLRRIPVEAAIQLMAELSSGLDDGRVSMKVPPLIVVERMVSSSLICFLRRQTEEGSKAVGE